jgi:16S rRNA (cytosine967-C5)-methyltransferase
MKNNNVRLLAVNILNRVGDGSYSNLTLDATIKKAKLESRDAGLLTTIVYGTIQHQMTLDFYLAPFVGKRKLDKWVDVLLRTAVYQMVYLDKVPNRAIFYESTEIAKKLGHAGVAKFVTAILRRMDREGLPDVAKIQDTTERLSVASSTPVWLVSKLIDQYGMDAAKAVLDDINHAPRAAVRVNTTITDADDLTFRVENQFELTPSVISPVGLTADSGHLALTPEFGAGYYTMQDESSQLVAPSMQLKPGDKVLDACAAPGGKTTHIAQFLDPKQGGSVTALDLHPHKVKLIEQNAERLLLSDRVHAQALDARKAADEFGAESFDQVLVDAPCSGLGLMRRKPEIKYDKSQADIDNLSRIQNELLDAIAPVVKIGGRLTYSTCTFAKEENVDVIAAFLKRHPEFNEQPVFTDKHLTKNHADNGLQLLPSDYGTDGFFIATLIRTR